VHYETSDDGKQQRERASLQSYKGGARDGGKTAITLRTEPKRREREEPRPTHR
jgi:hypothetical protein